MRPRAAAIAAWSSMPSSITSARPSRAKVPTARVTHKLLNSCSIFLCSNAGLTSDALSRLLSTIPFRKTSRRGDAQGGDRAPHNPIHRARLGTRAPAADAAPCRDCAREARERHFTVPIASGSMPAKAAQRPQILGEEEDDASASNHASHHMDRRSGSAVVRNIRRARSGQDLRAQAFALGAAHASAAEGDGGMGRDGIADFTYVNPGYQPGRFPIISAGELPFLVGDAKGGIRAIDAWYRKY